MKIFYATLIILVFFTKSFSQVSVKGYYRKDGTYVQPHQRTKPNNTITDNYSYPGNYNPNKEKTNNYSSYSSPTLQESTNDFISPFTTFQKRKPTNDSPIEFITNIYIHCFEDCTDRNRWEKKDSKITISKDFITINTNNYIKSYSIQGSDYTHESITNGDYYYIDILDGKNKITAIFYRTDLEKMFLVNNKMEFIKESTTGINLINYSTNEKNIYEKIEKK